MIKVQRNRGSEGKNTRGRKGGRGGGGGWKKESGNKTPLRERRESQVGMEVTLCDVAWSFHLSSLQLKAAWRKGPAFSKNRMQISDIQRLQKKNTLRPSMTPLGRQEANCG